MASGSNMNRISIHDEELQQHSQPSPLSPKPPSSSTESMLRDNNSNNNDYDAVTAAEVLAEDDDDDIASTDPPPPYPNSSIRGTRRLRLFRSSRRPNYQTVPMTYPSQEDGGAGQNDALPVIIDDHVLQTGGGDSEISPLLPTNESRRRRTASHSSTSHSIQSIGHTVITSSRNVISLFQSDSDPDGTRTLLDSSINEGEDGGVESPNSHRHGSFVTQLKRYFRPLVRRAYYSAIFHLLLINFPYELAAWIYLFVGTLTGTTLLITLPLGVILCFLDLIGARAFARGEIFLQTLFHGPLSVTPPTTPKPIFARMRVLSEPNSDNESQLGERERTAATRERELVSETSFLKLTYLMFTDPTSYQALFYFLVIKPGITLLITIGILVLLPPAVLLVIPAPAVFRAIRRIGIWQAEIAVDALN